MHGIRDMRSELGLFLPKVLLTMLQLQRHGAGMQCSTGDSSGKSHGVGIRPGLCVLP